MEERLLPSPKNDAGGVYLVDLSRLQVGDWFARGAYSVLYHGIYNGQSVAVKIITTTNDRQLKARLEKQFNREVTLLSRLHHHNVIKLVGACRKQSYLYILTEYYSNGSLRLYLHKMKHTPLPLKRVIDIGLDIARGMKYIHSQGIIHMDLKPENILIDEAFGIKIADFGIACPEANRDEFGDKAGTYRWMAPERIQKKSYGRKVDVYSFALILWEMISRSIPFHNLDAYQAAYAAAHKNLRPPIDESCPDVIRGIIERCWSTEPEKRPEFSELVQVLKECQASIAIDGTLSGVHKYVGKYGEGSSNGLLRCLHNICPAQT